MKTVTKTFSYTRTVTGSKKSGAKRPRPKLELPVVDDEPIAKKPKVR